MRDSSATTSESAIQRPRDFKQGPHVCGPGPCERVGTVRSGGRQKAFDELPPLVPEACHDRLATMNGRSVTS